MLIGSTRFLIYIYFYVYLKVYFFYEYSLKE